MEYKKSYTLVLSALMSFSMVSYGATITLNNPSFEEDNFSGWIQTEPVAVSGDAYDGLSSAKLEGEGARLEQQVSVPADTDLSLSAYVLDGAVVGAIVDGSTYQEESSQSDWTKTTVNFHSGNSTEITIFTEYANVEGHVDLFNLESDGNGGGGGTLPETNLPMFDLDSSLPPSGNFDLQDWKLDLPVNSDGELSGGPDAAEVKEDQLSGGFEDPDYFYTGDDGGLVFYSPVYGARTSEDTHYTRSELREMLRRGDTSIETSGIVKNNWVFSSAPQDDQDNSGGVDGVQEATLTVNHVTTTGDSDQVGRVIVGQIHANNDEPLRLYYRLLPGHTKGSVYFAHEPNKEVSSDGEQFIDLIGSSADDASEPEDGIALNEPFFYRIDVQGNDLYMTIRRDNKDDVTYHLDMSTSGYDVGGQYMYFKFGVYNQNNSGDPDDYAQATFYYLTNAHDGYDFPLKEDSKPYVEGFNYVEGNEVLGTDGNVYVCKPYPYSGWCQGAAWAYEPGVGSDWQSAWALK